eukprot:c9479_g1_i2.p1 GENE.c9479_g1_i2~~c9479_g1_i2.p1  ORF type:complete len:179 (-),score=42.74 c9479_g1_i2:113-610(-)
MSTPTKKVELREINPDDEQAVIHIKMYHKEEGATFLFEILRVEGFKSELKSFYETAHVCILCYKLDDVQTLRSIESEWGLDARFFCPNCDLMILGIAGFTPTTPSKPSHVDHKVPPTAAEVAHTEHSLRCFASYECRYGNADAARNVFLACAGRHHAPHRECNLM